MQDIRQFDFVECGCCGAYHRGDFFGDCRRDSERLSSDDLPEDALIYTLDEQMEDEEKGS